MADNIINISSAKEEVKNDSKYKKKSERKGVVNAWNVPIPKFQKGDMKHSLLDVTEFKVNFPQYRESYLKQSMPVLKKIMKEQGIQVELDLMQGSLSVRTTKETWDPYAIMLARDTIKLISRHVDLERAVKVFEEGFTSEIINIKNMCSEDVFHKRRERLTGFENKVLIALQKCTKCDVIIQGGTVAVIGPHKGVLQVMKVVKQNMGENIHPFNTVARLFKQTQLEANPDMKDADWSKLLPQVVKNTQSRKKASKKPKEKKEYNPFPPTPIESKLDAQIKEGEFFIKDVFKKGAFNKEEQKKRSEKIQAEKRAAQYIPPEEPTPKKRKKDKEVVEETSNKSSVDVEKLKKKVKKQKKKDRS